MKKLFGCLVGNTLSVLGIALNDAQLDKMESIISIVSSIAGLLITLTFAVIIPLIKWWKEAKKDGKIDEEEKEEAKNIFQKFIEIVKNFFNNIYTKQDLIDYCEKNDLNMSQVIRKAIKEYLEKYKEEN